MLVVELLLTVEGLRVITGRWLGVTGERGNEEYKVGRVLDRGIPEPLGGVETDFPGWKPARWRMADCPLVRGVVLAVVVDLRGVSSCSSVGGESAGLSELSGSDCCNSEGARVWRRSSSESSEDR